MGRVEGPLPCFPQETSITLRLGSPMLRSPLVRRVSIYLVLSTAAVTVANQLELDQNAAAPFYIPLFIGIYILSRWIDSRFGQDKAGEAIKPDQSGEPSTNSGGFKP